MTKEQEDSIEILKNTDISTIELAEITDLYTYSIAVKTVLSMLKEKDAKIEHLEENRNNKKAELAILNEKQKEMNKLINTVKSYKGMFKKQEKEINELQRENEELNKKIYLCTPEIPQCQHGKYVSYSDLINKIILKDKEIKEKDKQIDLTAEFIKNNMSEKKIINEICIKGKCNNEECHEDDLKECIKQYFEKLAKEKGE